MATITLKGNPINTSGTLPAVGTNAPALSLTSVTLQDVGLADFAGVKVLNIFPSVDTGVCAASVRRFNADAAGKDCTVLNVAADLPFALKRFCGAEGLDGVHALSSFRSSFAKDWGLEIVDGPMAGLCSRAVVIVDAKGKVIYTEQVPEIVQEPNYEAALAVVS